jgi:hypothetical protein
MATVRGPIAHLAGFAKLPQGDAGGAPGAEGWGFEAGSDIKKRKQDADGGGAAEAAMGALTEVVVLRDPPLVQVYRVESYGRRWRRALVFASSAAWCLADIDPDGAPALEAGAYTRPLFSST